MVKIWRDFSFQAARYLEKGVRFTLTVNVDDIWALHGKDHEISIPWSYPNNFYRRNSHFLEREAVGYFTPQEVAITSSHIFETGINYEKSWRRNGSIVCPWKRFHRRYIKDGIIDFKGHPLQAQQIFT